MSDATQSPVLKKKPSTGPVPVGEVAMTIVDEMLNPTGEVFAWFVRPTGMGVRELVRVTLTKDNGKTDEVIACRMHGPYDHNRDSDLDYDLPWCDNCGRDDTGVVHDTNANPNRHANNPYASVIGLLQTTLQQVQANKVHVVNELTSAEAEVQRCKGSIADLQKKEAELAGAIDRLIR